MGLLKHDDILGDALTFSVVGGHFRVEGNKIFGLHTSTVEAEVLNEAVTLLKKVTGSSRSL